MNRVAIIGPPGSGKSTLARSMGQILGIDVVHLDAIFWHAGWIETPQARWREMQHQLVEPARWIIDGNYGSTLDIRLASADTVIFLDFSRRYTIPRVIRRSLQYYGKTRPDLAPGCPEKLDWEFVWWVWHFPKRQRATIEKYRTHRPGDQHWVCLRSPREVREFIATLGITTLA